ncbi:Redoxin, partial [Gilbertella persicaria]|uniref:Redoxin n=1 Tax=Gilbertella persicaria TaxID=101096 RepID=UPI00221E6B26
SIQIGDIIPDATLQYVPYDPQQDLKACPHPFKIHDELKDKKAIIFAIPGPFTPACSETHVPGFLNAHAALKSKGVDKIICISVTDGFVMNAFAKTFHTSDVIMAGDGSAFFSSALGLTQDLTKMGMGIRSKRFAIVVDNLVVKYIGVEKQPGVTSSGADAVLAKL